MNLRGYVFGNMYLSTIQQGIQGEHVLGEMVVKYLNPHVIATSGVTKQGITLYDYLDKHKTTIHLNAGYSSELRLLIDHFESSQNPYPWSYFCESEEALDGALTGVGIVLPESIYYVAELMRKDVITAAEIIHNGEITYVDSVGDNVRQTITKWEYETMLLINKYGLAR